MGLRNLTFWSMILTIIGLLTWLKVQGIKENYTDLHHRVNQIERIVGELTKE